MIFPTPITHLTYSFFSFKFYSDLRTHATVRLKCSLHRTVSFPKSILAASVRGHARLSPEEKEALRREREVTSSLFFPNRIPQNNADTAKPHHPLYQK